MMVVFLVMVNTTLMGFHQHCQGIHVRRCKDEHNGVFSSFSVIGIPDIADAKKSSMSVRS